MSNIEIGKRLCSIRKKKGFTQRDVEEKTGIPNAHLSKIEKGRVNFRVESFMNILDAIECSLGVFSRWNWRKDQEDE